MYKNGKMLRQIEGDFHIEIEETHRYSCGRVLFQKVIGNLISNAVSIRRIMEIFGVRCIKKEEM